MLTMTMLYILIWFW